MRVLSWNVNSLAPTVRNVQLKYGSLKAFFEDQLAADIVCMQEVKLPDAKLTKELVLVEGWQSYWACSLAKPGYSGVTTWAREGLAALSAEADPFAVEGCQDEGRALVTDHGPFVLINVYVPNAGERPARPRLAAKLAFLAALQRRVGELIAAGRQVMVVGDLNVCLDRLDVHSAINFDKLFCEEERAALRSLLASTPDVWRARHPQQGDVYTVWSEKTSARAFNVGERIDFTLASPALLPAVTGCEVLLDTQLVPPKWSDHAPVSIDLDLAAVAALAGQPQQPGQPAPAQQPAPHGAPAQQQARGASPPACAMWLALLKRFQDPSQRSIAAMFAAAAGARPKARPSAEPAAGGSGSGSKAAVAQPAAGAGGGNAAAAPPGPGAGEAGGEGSGSSCKKRSREEQAAARPAEAGRSRRQQPSAAAVPTGAASEERPAKAAKRDCPAAAEAGNGQQQQQPQPQQAPLSPLQQQRLQQQGSQQGSQPQPASQAKQPPASSKGKGGSGKGGGSSSSRKAAPVGAAAANGKQSTLLAFFAAGPSPGKSRQQGKPL